MGLSIWSEEGNAQDLSFWFLPTAEKQKTSQAADTPSYMDEYNYAKAPEKAKVAPSKINLLPIVLVIGALYALGVIKV